MGRPTSVPRGKDALNEEEVLSLSVFGDSLTKHTGSLEGLSLAEKIQYFADAVYTNQNRNNPAMTAVPFKPFLWMLCQSGLVPEQAVIDGLLRVCKFHPEEDGKMLLIPSKVVIGTKRRRTLDTTEMRWRLEEGELDILDYDKLFRMAMDSARRDLKALSLALYQELLIPNRALRSISLVPQENVVMGVNRGLYLGWYEGSENKVPYLYMMLDVASLAAASQYWPIVMGTDWLRARNDRKFVVDSGAKVSARDYILPMCLASMDTFAADAENQVRGKITRFLTAVSKQK